MKATIKTTQINLKEYQEAPYNPNVLKGKNLDRVVGSIEHYGMLQPIVVNKQTNNVVGGNHRYRYMVQKGYETTDAIVVDISLEEEQALNILLNTSGEHDPVKLATIILELHNNEKKITETLLLLNEQDIKSAQTLLSTIENKELLKEITDRMYLQERLNDILNTPLKDLKFRDLLRLWNTHDQLRKEWLIENPDIKPITPLNEDTE